jgi:Ras-related protein Rab-1A
MGQERFRVLSSSYYRGAHGILIVYDVTNAESFNNVKKWLSEVDSYAPEHVNKILVGAKADLTAARQVTMHEAQEFAAALDISFVETSAKTSLDVERAFNQLARDVKARVETD